MDIIIQIVLSTILIDYLACKYKMKLSPIFFQEGGLQNMGSKYVLIIPIVSSIALILLFFFSNIMMTLLKIVQFFASFVFIELFFEPIVDFFLAKKNHPLSSKQQSIICSIIATLFLIVYYFNMNPMTTNILCFLTVVIIQTPTFFSKINVPLLLMIGMFFYDIFWVFGSTKVSVFDGKSVMEEVATKTASHNLTMAFTFKSFITGASGLLGLGDIVLPGIFVSFCYCIDHIEKTQYFIYSVIGHCLGLILASVAVRIFRTGQPALLYIVPCMLILFVLYGLYSKTLKKVFQIDIEKELKKSIEQNDEINENETQNDEIKENEININVIDDNQLNEVKVISDE